MSSYQIQCRHFSGYKPCGLSANCNLNCASLSPVENRILIIHLGALGAVVRSTALLNSIHQKYPAAHITWVTQKPADQLLRFHPLVDRVLTTASEDILSLSALKFDAAYVIDKSLLATGILQQTEAKAIFGFKANSMGSILPATVSANELWEIGLDDHLKFKLNQKSEIQLLQEALELGAESPSPYHLPLRDLEALLVQEKRKLWSDSGRYQIVGLNTGCSDVIAYKKLSVQAHRQLIQKLTQNPKIQVVLLGGPEDTERNQQIAYGLPVIQSETRQGLREGLTSVAACDLVFTGDSLGMHMAISQNVYTLAWFGPTCAQEIELYGNGEKILSNATCGPCWKRLCQKEVMCYDLVDLDDVNHRIQKKLNEKNHRRHPNSISR